MEEDPSVRQLLAEQKQIIPLTTATADIPAAPAPLLALAMGGRGPVFAAPAPVQVAPPVPTPLAQDRRPMVPDFRGKTMRDAMEAASENGIEVMVEGSGVARAQEPLPGTPLRQGDKIRIVFTR
jgi:hypothetical protein